jgi:hypothetical protein
VLDVGSWLRDTVACVSEWTHRAVSAADAPAVMSSGITAFVHGAAATPTPLLDALAASQMARYVIAEINDRMPRTHGNTLVPMSRIHAFIHTSRPLWVHEAARRPLKNRPSAPTSRRSSRTVPRCKWGLARFRTPCIRGDLRRAFAETRHITV